MPGHNVTLFVRSLPNSATNKQLEEIFSEIGPVKQCFVVNEKGTQKCRGFGYVTYAMAEDAQRAMKVIKDYDGKQIFVSLAKKKIVEKGKAGRRKPVEKEEGQGPAEPASEEPAKEPKKPPPPANPQKATDIKKIKLKSKLIIRNLSFQCSEEDLKKEFSKFGKVLESHIPLKPDGKMRGFGFVLFKNMCEAGTALSKMNMKEIKGRQVAVDWAIPKDKFVAAQASTNSDPKKQEKAQKSTTVSESEDEEDEEEEESRPPPKNTKASSKPTAHLAEGSLSEEEEESSEDEESEEEEEEKDESSSSKSDDDDNDGGDDDEDEDDEDDEDEYDDEEESNHTKPKRPPPPSDVNEGRTIFIRNLSFDTEEEGLEEVLLQYGELKYIKIVLHPETEHSKGCAFAQFKSKEAAENCIAAAQEEREGGGIRVDGRKLIIVSAVTREDAAKLKDKKVKVETGTRNLYLAREGLIRAGTKSAEGVSEADMARRTKLEEVKRAKLRDINVFLSKTRLSIHNLPKSVNDSKLRQLCLSAVKSRGKKARITECRVMYDKKPEKGHVVGHSLGYGFVQYADHEDALATLRHLNNNPDIFGPIKRPIVEFSLEDGRKLKMKEMRQQKNKERFTKGPPNAGGKPQSLATGKGKGPAKGGDNSSPMSKPAKGNTVASPQNQKKSIGFSGFQTNPEVEHIELEDGKKRRKVLPLPSHKGPKIRMRDKGKQQAPPPKKKSKQPGRRDRKGKVIVEKPTQMGNKPGKVAKKHSRNRDEDRFESLVQQYKKKLLGTGTKTTNLKRSKWFNS